MTGWFVKALGALPSSLKDAIVEAELDNPVVLRSFRSSSAEQLGICEGGRREHILFGTDDAYTATEVDGTAGKLENLAASAAAVGIL